MKAIVIFVDEKDEIIVAKRNADNTVADAFAIKKDTFLYNTFKPVVESKNLDELRSLLHV